MGDAWKPGLTCAASPGNRIVGSVLALAVEDAVELHRTNLIMQTEHARLTDLHGNLVGDAEPLADSQKDGALSEFTDRLVAVLHCHDAHFHPSFFGVLLGNSMRLRNQERKSESEFGVSRTVVYAQIRRSGGI